MIVMVANNSGAAARKLARDYPGAVGHLYSPGAQRGPWPEFPYALDNGRFPCRASGRVWDADAFLSVCRWACQSEQAPRWLLVPDVVANPVDTILEWSRWAPGLRGLGFPLAFAAQDGHRPEDVPRDADVVFVGGSTDWKWATMRMWCANFPRVHVGRVNGIRRLIECQNAGAESVDGTGWFRGDQAQLSGLIDFLRAQKNGNVPEQLYFEVTP